MLRQTKSSPGWVWVIISGTTRESAQVMKRVWGVWPSASSLNSLRFSGSGKTLWLKSSTPLSRPRRLSSRGVSWVICVALEKLGRQFMTNAGWADSPTYGRIAPRLGTNRSQAWNESQPSLERIAARLGTTRSQAWNDSQPSLVGADSSAIPRQRARVRRYRKRPIADESAPTT